MAAVVIIITVLIGYLTGSINTAIIVSKMRGSDIRNHGSGNAGLTNMLRTYGSSAAALTLLGDILKGVIAVGVTPYVASVICLITKTSAENPEDFVLMLKCVAALSCVLGHNFPVYFKFRGGKGVLTGASVIGMIDWKILVSALVVFIVICACTRYVSLSSIAASGVIILMAFVLYGESIATLGGASVIIMCTVMGAMVIIRHKSNIARLIKGNERKLGEKKE